MRALLVVLSIGLLFVVIQYAHGNPIKSAPSSSEEDDSVESHSIDDPKPSNNESDESDEMKLEVKAPVVPTKQNKQEVKLLNALKFIEKSNEDSESEEDDSSAAADRSESSDVDNDEE